MKFILGLIASCITTSAFAQDFTEYQQLNNAESRLSEYKDSDEDLKLKLQQLEVINKSLDDDKCLPIFDLRQPKLV